MLTVRRTKNTPYLGSKPDLVEMALTPTTALLYSYLDLTAFESPRTSPQDEQSNVIQDEQDPFAHAFQKHTTRGTLKNDSIDQTATLPLKGLYTTPPLSIEETTNSPVLHATDVFAQQSVLSSRMPSYLEHVLSTQSPDDFFSHAQKCHNIGTFHPSLVHLSTEGNDTPQNLAPGGGCSDLFTGCSKPLEGKPLATELKVLPVSDSVVQTRKTRKCRKNRTKEEEAARHAAFLERNRKAAGKCRMKKKDWVRQLTADVDTARLRNRDLKAERWELMNEVAQLRELMQKQKEMSDKELVMAIEGTGQYNDTGFAPAVAIAANTLLERPAGGRKSEKGAMDEMDHEMTTYRNPLETSPRERVLSLVSTSSKETSEESKAQTLDGSQAHDGDGGSEIYATQAMEE